MGYVIIDKWLQLINFERSLFGSSLLQLSIKGVGVSYIT